MAESSDDQRMPRWVKVMLVVVGVLALAVVAHRFIGGGQHGPDRHVPAGGLGAVPRMEAA
jgi:hypothetical protein